ncbi:MAG: cytochrome c oxidase assembly protein, partial [Acidimicrobiales bacterium]
LGGLFSVWLALCSSVATFANSSFVFHISQHLLLMVIAPPLGALGAPMTLLLQTTGRRFKTGVLRVLHSRVFAVVRHPVPVFFMYYLAMYAFFLSEAVGYAMEHVWVMDLINLGFLFGATLFWWPMVGVDPIPGGRMSSVLKVINLLIGVPVESFLGIAIMEKRATVAPMYTLRSTHLGGALLWIGSEVATLLAVIPVYVEWVRSDTRLAKRIDARLDAGQPVGVPPPAGAGMAATLRSLRRG